MSATEQKVRGKSASQYPIPFMLRAKLGTPLRGLCFFMFFMLMLTLCLPLFNYIFSTDSVRVLRLRPLPDVFVTLFMAVAVLSPWLYIDVFHRVYIFGDADGLRIKWVLQRTRKIPWEQIGMVDMMRTVGYHAPREVRAAPGCAGYVRLVLRETDTKCRFLHRFPKTYNIGAYLFADLDLYRFVNTVSAEMEKASKRH